MTCAQKGLVGKWPKCRKPAEPDIAAQPCPEGLVRKGKKCVELTKGDGGKKPPRVVKTETATVIPPAIAVLLNLTRSRRLSMFAYYCWAIGVVALVVGSR